MDSNGRIMAEHSRERARELLEEWTQGESLRKHGMAVSVCTEAYGVKEAARLGLAGDEAEEFVASVCVRGTAPRYGL